MEQAEVKYAPGMRIIVRGEEWMVKKVETNSLGNQTLYVIGLSQLVKDYESMFLVDVENDIEIVDPAKVTLVPDDSAFFRKSKVYIESQWRSKIPTDNKIHIGNKAAMDLMSYQLEPAQMALNKTRQRILIADTVRKALLLSRERKNFKQLCRSHLKNGESFCIQHSVRLLKKTLMDLREY